MRYFIKADKTILESHHRLRLDLLSSPLCTTVKVKEHKTILVLGSSRSGKTTFVNALFNALLDVEFDDYFRFEVEDEHKGKSRYKGAIRQTSGETTWIMAYSFQDRDIVYTIIDTPGFDQGPIVDCAFDEQLMKALISKRTEGVSLAEINAVCLVDSKPNTEASEFSRYWLERVLKIFNGVSNENIFLVKTFGTSTSPNRSLGDNSLDGEASSENAMIERFGQQFAVDTENLFTLISEMNENSQCKWEKNQDKCKQLISSVLNLKSSLKVKSWVAPPKLNLVDLENAVLEVQHTFARLLYESANLERERARVNEMREQINIVATEELTYSVTILVAKEPEKPQGHHVTTCLLCMHTCHEVCMIEQDKDKFGCWAMNHQEAKEARHCRICQQHCHWKQHSNVRHSDVLEYEEKIEIKVVHETLRRYSIAASDIRKGEKLVAAMQRNIAHLLLQMIAQLEEVNRFQKEVEQLENWKNPGRRDFVDMFIHKELNERTVGYEDRLNQLRNVKKGKDYVQKRLMPNDPHDYNVE